MKKRPLSLMIAAVAALSSVTSITGLAAAGIPSTSESYESSEELSGYTLYPDQSLFDLGPKTIYYTDSERELIYCQNMDNKYKNIRRVRFYYPYYYIRFEEQHELPGGNEFMKDHPDTKKLEELFGSDYFVIPTAEKKSDGNFYTYGYWIERLDNVMDDDNSVRDFYAKTAEIGAVKTFNYTKDRVEIGMDVMDGSVKVDLDELGLTAEEFTGELDELFTEKSEAYELEELKNGELLLKLKYNYNTGLFTDVLENAQKLHDKYGFRFGMYGLESAGSTYSTEIDVANSISGDANCDGKLTIADSTRILQALGNPDKYGLSPQGSFNADIYEPGSGVTGMDAVHIQMIDAGLV